MVPKLFSLPKKVVYYLLKLQIFWIQFIVLSESGFTNFKVVSYKIRRVQCKRSFRNYCQKQKLQIGQIYDVMQTIIFVCHCIFDRLYVLLMLYILSRWINEWILLIRFSLCKDLLWMYIILFNKSLVDSGMVLLWNQDSDRHCLAKLENSSLRCDKRTGIILQLNWQHFFQYLLFGLI